MVNGFQKFSDSMLATGIESLRDNPTTWPERDRRQLLEEVSRRLVAKWPGKDFLPVHGQRCIRIQVGAGPELSTYKLYVEQTAIIAGGPTLAGLPRPVLIVRREDGEGPFVVSVRDATDVDVTGGE